jgi:hypothetical protein
VVALHLGGIFGRWELLVTGHPLVQVGLADKQARATEVLLSPEAWGLLQERCEGELRSRSFICLKKVKSLPLRPLVLPTLPTASESVLWSCIPRAVLKSFARWTKSMAIRIALFNSIIYQLALTQ